ncbi:MAG: T9SS C-terminal target domain-containing protein [Bacteroidetes bacterium]|nr:MAG: T9SS C-terminal target domain-containing protein [Bacteroidota bacterium]
MKTLNYLIFLTGCLLSCSYLFGQGVELCTENRQDQLSLFLQPQESFGGVVSELRFSLRWSQQNGRRGSIHLHQRWQSSCSIQPVGDSVRHGDYYYQTFAGFGVKKLQDTGQAWYAADRIPVITFSGSHQLELALDEWVQDQNRSFYLELDGLDHTGTFCRTVSTIPSVTDWAVNLYPNPVKDWLQLEIKGREKPTEARFFDLMGRQIKLYELNQHGTSPLTLDVRGWPPGIYLCRLSVQGITQWYKIKKI